MHLDLRTIQHLNFVVDDYDAALRHFVDNLGARHNWELEVPNRPDDLRCSLITLGPQLFEIFGPEPGSRHGIARIRERRGAGFVGIEWGLGEGSMNLDDLVTAKKVLAEHGIRIKYEPVDRYWPGTWLVSEPDDLFGLTLECFIGTWYVPEVAGYGMEPVAPVSFWRDEHPLGIHGLRNFTMAVHDVGAAAKRWQDLTGADEVSCGPAADRMVRYFTAANTTMGLVAPTSDNQVGTYLDRRGESIYSVSYLVNDPAHVAVHLSSKAVPVERVNDEVVVVPAEGNHGVRIEFVRA